MVLDVEDFGYEVIKMGGEALGCRLMRGTEEAWAVLRLDFIPTLEVNGQQRVVWQLGWFHLGRWSLGGLSLGREDWTQSLTGPA
jgi:hypothetical protein